MCANADYREGFRVLIEEWRRLMRRVAARWRSRNVPADTRLPAAANRAG